MSNSKDVIDARWILSFTYVKLSLELSFINQQKIAQLDGLFFNQFFTLLILADVIILLISFRYTEEYAKLIRNTGFIIATILIRLSFSAEGYLATFLILTGVSFALLILQIYNAMENPK